MGLIKDKLMTLTRQLYPTGRAWKLPFGGFFEKLHLGLAVSEERAYNDSYSIYYSLLPDNANFTSDDATDWERRLGLITNLATPLADRKAAILSKLQEPGLNPARSNYLFLQNRLQSAGFNVFVYENIIELYPSGYGGVYNPVTLNANIFTELQQGMGQQGDYQQGGFINHVIVNSMDNTTDTHFDVGSTLRSTFFIGGAPLGTYANVPVSRELEFRQLILQLKPVPNVAYLFVNFV